MQSTDIQADSKYNSMTARDKEYLAAVEDLQDGNPEKKSSLQSCARGAASTPASASTPDDNSCSSASKHKTNSAAYVEANEKMILFLTGKPSSARSRYAKAFKFPTKLFYTLECGEYPSMISWTANGRAFQVKKPEDFAKKVLPAIFREAKFSSFHRKLNRWNFIKIPGKQGTYSHPLFRRGQINLCRQISCSGGTNDIISAFPGEMSSILNSELTGGGALGASISNVSDGLQYASSIGGAAAPLPPFSAGGTHPLLLRQHVTDLRQSLVHQDATALLGGAGRLIYNPSQNRIFDGAAHGISPFDRSAVGPNPNNLLSVSQPPSSSASYFLGGAAGGRGHLLEDNQGVLALNGSSIAPSSTAAYSRIAELENELWHYRRATAGIQLAPGTAYDDIRNLVQYPNEFDSLAGVPGSRYPQSQTLAQISGRAATLGGRDISTAGGAPNQNSNFLHQQQQSRGAPPPLGSSLEERQRMSASQRIPPNFDSATGTSLAQSRQLQQVAAAAGGLLPTTNHNGSEIKQMQQSEKPGSQQLKRKVIDAREKAAQNNARNPPEKNAKNQ